jgi:putative ABC transport system permease protein
MAGLRHAFRSLVATPSATILTILTLALGIACSTAMFSVVEALVLRPLPLDAPERLVMVWESHQDQAGSHGPGRNVVGPANFVEWRDRATSFEGLSLFAGGDGATSLPISVTISGVGDPFRSPAAISTGDFFRTLGAHAQRGRTLQPGDSRDGAPRVVVMSSHFWRRILEADPQVVGRSLVINGSSTQVVGVVDAEGLVPVGADLWLPMTENEQFRNARGRWAAVVGRLEPGVSIAQAQSELATIAAAIARQRSQNAGWSVSVVPLAGELVRTMRPALRIAVLGVACVLAIGCLNAVNLLLARALARQRELGVRLALGASTRRLLWPLLLESVVIGVISGAIGVALASWGLETWRATIQTLLASGAAITLNASVTAFAVGLVATCSLACGIVPAWLAARRASLDGLREGRMLSSSRGVTRARGLLVLTEIAVATAMLVTAGLLVRSYWRLIQIDPGFEAAQVVTLRAAPTGDAYREDAATVAYFERVRAALLQVPGVSSAGAISWRPLVLGSATSYRMADEPIPAPGSEPTADVRVVTADLLETLRIPRRAGRLIEVGDDREAPRIAVVNEAFANAHGGVNGIVAREAVVHWGGVDGGIRVAVVGVVGDARLRALDTPPRPMVYLPLPQSPTSVMTMAVRVTGDARTAGASLRQAAAAVDPAVPVTDVETLEEVVDASIGRPRVLLAMLVTGASIALVLALIGLYGVLAHDVRQRAREIGLRMAVGASPRQVVRLIAGDGVKMLAIGSVLGLALGALLGSALEGQLFEVGRLDLVTYTLALVLFGLVGMAATAIPAWRAARLDPAEVLRQE